MRVLLYEYANFLTSERSLEEEAADSAVVKAAERQALLNTRSSLFSQNNHVATELDTCRLSLARPSLSFSPLSVLLSSLLSPDIRW